MRKKKKIKGSLRTTRISTQQNQTVTSDNTLSAFRAWSFFSYLTRRINQIGEGGGSHGTLGLHLACSTYQVSTSASQTLGQCIGMRISPPRLKENMKSIPQIGKNTNHYIYIKRFMSIKKKKNVLLPGERIQNFGNQFSLTAPTHCETAVTKRKKKPQHEHWNFELVFTLITSALYLFVAFPLSFLKTESYFISFNLLKSHQKKHQILNEYANYWRLRSLKNPILPPSP